MIWHEYLNTVTDPAHVLTELTFILGEAIVGFIVGRIVLRRHDRKIHHTNHGGSNQ